MLARSMHWALLHGIAPSDAYRLDLYGGTIDEALAHVLESETAAFHRARSRPSVGFGKGPALLSDKAGSLAALADAGLRTPRTVEYWHAGTKLDALPDFASEVVTKPNRGGARRGVIAIRPGDPAAYGLRGRRVHASALAMLNDQFDGGDDVIVQRRLATHSGWAHLGQSAEEAVVIRIITAGHNEPQVDFAMAEIPILRGDRRFYAGIEILDGRLARALDAEDESLVGMTVPGWDAIAEAVVRAHAISPIDEIYAVAWDVVPTDDGPVILEGNTSWDVVTPQRWSGPLLADADTIDRILRPTR